MKYIGYHERIAGPEGCSCSGGSGHTWNDDGGGDAVSKNDT